MARAKRGGDWWTPAMDVLETPDRFLVRVDLAGVGREDVEVTVEEDSLVVSGRRRRAGRRGLRLSRREREYGAFQRTLELPPTADRSALAASLREGVLEVRIGKKPQQVPRQVEIRAGEEESPPSSVGDREDGK